jgi:hypothetical protein
MPQISHQYELKYAAAHQTKKPTKDDPSFPKLFANTGAWKRMAELQQSNSSTEAVEI